MTTIPVTDDGEIVLLRRGIEPGRGWWAQPGGFLEVDETVTEAASARRSRRPGLIVEPGEIVGLYSRLEAAVVVLAFEARVVGGELPPATRRRSRSQASGRRTDPVAGDRLQDDVLTLAAELRGTRAATGTRRAECPGRSDRRPATRRTLRTDGSTGTEARAAASARLLLTERSMKTFFVSVYRSSADIPSSRPMPDIL